MRYAGIIYDDTAAAPGLSLSLYTQGCPFHCKGCHNPETWDFEGGYEYTAETQEKIIKSLNANGVLRNLCILGGEPLLEENILTLSILCGLAKALYPDIKIYIWTGYTMDEIQDRVNSEPSLYSLVFELTDTLVTGRYEEDKRDITLPLRGSWNQEIWELH